MEVSSTGAVVDLDDETVVKPALHHVNLKTTRLDEIIEWYGKVVGTTPNFRSPGIAFITNDEANHRIALVAPPHVEPVADKRLHDGMHHTAWEYGSLDELLGTYLRLEREGIVPQFCLDHGLTMSFYYADPDGNFVELQADNYGDWAASTQFIREDPSFAEDPIGKFVDPDALVAARRAGADRDELHERAFAGEFAPATPPDIGL